MPAEAADFEFYDGFETGLDKWDGILRGFEEDPIINNTFAHSGSCSLYCYSNHGLYKTIPLSNVVDIQFYYNLVYIDDADCQTSHVVDVRNTEKSRVFAAVYMYGESNSAPARIELKHLINGEFHYVWNGSIPYEAWNPTTWHSIRLRVCLESTETANDGSYQVWLDDVNIINITDVDTVDNGADQVQLGQQSTFHAYAYFDDVTILATKAELPEAPEFPLFVIVLIIAVVVVAVLILAKKLLSKKSGRTR